MSGERSSIFGGALLALGAAVAFGSTTPFIRHFGHGAGPFTTACLLYLGAALIAVAWRGAPSAEAAVRRAHLPRIVLVALAGAVVAPTALAWGLQRSDATSASLLLNFEAVFTVLLARFVFHEELAGRVWVAVALMIAGGCVLVLDQAHAGASTAWGLIAVVVATMAWATDNTLTRPLADLDPMGIIARKAALGAVFTAAGSLALREALPTLTSAAVLLVCGATGYGLSLRLYLLAQRRIGAARTGSVFAVAPFFGAALAPLVGENGIDRATIGAGLLFALAVYLHLFENHAHAHTHAAIAHEHAHRHDDGHHEHAHDPPVAGAHSHPHEHSAIAHVHEHAPDMHHVHRH
jgi:drug/metabolite transporter (DMT)-like permease